MVSVERVHIHYPMASSQTQRQLDCALETRKRRVIGAMIGSREFYQSFKILHKHGHLARLITDFWIPPKHPARFIAETVWRRRGTVLSSRYSRALEDANVKSFPRIGAQQYLGERLCRTRRARYELWRRCGQRFAQESIRWLDVEHDVYYGFSSGALESLKYENRNGKLTVLNQIDLGRSEEEMVLSEARDYPRWAPQERQRVPEAYFERIEAEWAEAKRIIVNSRWSKEALVQQGIPRERIFVSPLSYESAGGGDCIRPEVRDSIKVLWLGTLCLRKGIVHAIEAARLLENSRVTFTFAGNLDVTLPSLPRNCSYIGHVPRMKLGEVYAAHHIFILPTLSDGFGLTQVEALAHGLPVIATRCCGDVVEHGVSGLLVSPRDAVGLAQAILEVGSDKDTVRSMSENALRRATAFRSDCVWPSLAVALDL